MSPSPRTPARAPGRVRSRLGRLAGRAVASIRSRHTRKVIDRTITWTGETLLTLGVILGLFVAWELWWTDLGATNTQDEIVTDLGWENSAPVGSVDLTQHGEAIPGIPVIPTGFEERTDNPPVLPQPAHATTFATMYVPRWGYDYVKPISQGTDKRGVLDPLGIGHYNGTAMPGGWGNFAMAGHRTTYGKPFSRIDELQVGDPIVIRTEGAWYVYKVIGTDIVSPSYTAAIAPVPGQAGQPADGRYLTLTSCHPKYSARQRYIVYAELDYWAPSGAGYPSELIPQDVETFELPPSPEPSPEPEPTLGPTPARAV